MANRKRRRAKKKPTPKELPEPVKTALERSRGDYFAADPRLGSDARPRTGGADGRRAAQQHRHQAK
jgi:hypothetical protein